MKSELPSAFRGVRADLVIATLALLASASASIATVVQTRTITNQLSASVWPYLTFEFTLQPRSLTANLVNQGLGPALIRTFSLSYDRRRVGRYRDVIVEIDPGRSHRTVVASDLGGGAVIRPGESLAFLRLHDAKLDLARASAALRRANATICYCSLGNCWTLDANELEPHAVHACGPPTGVISY